MRVVDLIQTKRDGGELSREEIEYFLGGFVKGEIADFQASAFLMVICFHGFSDQELADWAQCIVDTRNVLAACKVDGGKVWKA